MLYIYFFLFAEVALMTLQLAYYLANLSFAVQKFENSLLILPTKRMK